jgi:antitoxin VapB
VASGPNDGKFLALSRYDGWSMNIRSAKVDQLVQRLARLSRVAPPAPADRKAALDSFFERVSRMPVLDARPADEIVGYDGYGLPS